MGLYPKRKGLNTWWKTLNVTLTSKTNSLKTLNSPRLRGDDSSLKVALHQHFHRKLIAVTWTVCHKDLHISRIIHVSPRRGHFHESGVVKRKWNSDWNHAQKTLANGHLQKTCSIVSSLPHKGHAAFVTSTLWSLVLTANPGWGRNHPHILCLKEVWDFQMHWHLHNQCASGSLNPPPFLQISESPPFLQVWDNVGSVLYQIQV